MGWIKRNLFFVVGGVVALSLLGTGGFYIYKGWSRNAEASDKLNEIYGTLKSLQQQKPAPGNEKVDNRKIAQEQEQQLNAWISSAESYFQPVPAIPDGDVTSKTYATALGSTIYQLQQEAKSDNVTLPPQYFFSFDAQNNKLTISPASLGPLSVQLGEVKAIAETIFSARVNDLDGIQRERVSEEDLAGPQGDYIDEPAVTNSLAVITPYVVTFRCFTPELARVVAAFASSSNAFVVKAIKVQPATATTAAAGDATVGMMPGAYPPGMMPGHHGGQFGYPLGQVPAPAVQPVVGKGGLQTVLKEQLLRISMEVDLVKLLPKN